MEILVGLLALGGLAFAIQSKALPSEADFKKAKDKLDSNPVDPDANTVVGKYLAFVQGDYPSAMPYLVHSSDKTLKTLAEHELDPQYADTPPKKLGMGDEWVTAGKNFQPIYRSFYDRASQHYAAAWPDLDGVWKDKLRERARKILLSPGQGSLKKGAPAGWTASGTPKIFTDSTVARSGRNSIKIEGDNQKNQWGVSSVGTTAIPVTPGDYILSGLFASDGTDSGKDRLLLTFYSKNGAWSGSTGPYLSPDTPFWQRLETKIVVPNDISRVVVEVLADSKKGAVWADDISLKSVAGKELIENGGFEK